MLHGEGRAQVGLLYGVAVEWDGVRSCCSGGEVSNECGESTRRVSLFPLRPIGTSRCAGNRIAHTSTLSKIQRIYERVGLLLFANQSCTTCCVIRLRTRCTGPITFRSGRTRSSSLSLLPLAPHHTSTHVNGKHVLKNSVQTSR